MSLVEGLLQKSDIKRTLIENQKRRITCELPPQLSQKDSRATIFRKGKYCEFVSQSRAACRGLATFGILKCRLRHPISSECSLARENLALACSWSMNSQIQPTVLEMALYLCFYSFSPPLFLSRSDDSKELCQWSEVQCADHKRLRIYSCEAI